MRIKNSSLPALACLMAMLSAPPLARADNFFGTIGIGIAVGTVLGASTLPFYDQPGTHMKNLAYGASLGAVTGLGVLVYGLFTGSPKEEDEWSSLRDRRNLDPTQYDGTLAFRGDAPAAPDFYMPVVSFNW